MVLNIGENVKKLRLEKGITQEQLAEHLAITYQSVSKWENNITNPDIYLIPQIAEYFEIPIDELFKPNMKGYKNKAQRLLAIYEQSGKKEDFEKAEKEYEKIFSENKADGEDMRCYGVLNESRSYALVAKAEELYKQAISMGTQAESQLISLLSKTSRNEENITNQEEALKNDPDSVRSWQLLVSAYICAQMYEKTLDVAKKGIEKFPNDADLLSMCGDACRMQEKYNDAIRYHEKAIKHDPSYIGSYYSLAFIYQDMHKYNEAIIAWENVVKYNLGAGFDVDMAWPQKEIAKLKSLIENM